MRIADLNANLNYLATKSGRSCEPLFEDRFIKQWSANSAYYQVSSNSSL